MMGTVLHLHAGNQWHDDGYVVGDRQGLLRLREAIDNALAFEAEKTGQSCAAVYVNDGEGYNCYVICVPNAQIDSLAVPYTDSIASIQDSNVVLPWEFVFLF
jgi:hypothetical protein